MNVTSTNTASVVTCSSTVPVNVNNAFASSPIHKLPVELIETICFYVADPEVSGKSCIRDHCWLLSKICRSWREVVMSSARLWRNINVVVPFLSQLRDPVALLSLALSRTSQADLFIEFDAGIEVDDDGFPVASDGSSELALTLLEMLIARSTQWYDVYFRALDPDCARALAAVRGRLPRLSYLQIPWKPSADGVLHFTSAPQLQEMYVWSVDQDRFPSQTQPLPFEVQTTAYDCSLIHLLRDCSSLNSLAITDFPSSPPVAARVASELTELFFAGDHHDLTLVHLPKLTTIRMGNSRSLEIGLPSLFDLLKYSKCPLDYLEFVNCDLSVGSLTKILEISPNLTELIIAFEFVSMDATNIANVNRALSTLLTDMANMDLIPGLEKLTFTFHKADASRLDFTFLGNGEVATMLRDRNKQSGLKAYFRFGNEFIHEDGWQTATIGRDR
ncbi:hypothetical protein CPB85DRAFT_992985 [Mucidula mucida]|nr:hypothetical protein CPB85DRAFT_992985 [Mucidula mucida]